MTLPYIFSYHFYPVGQGLFATGAIRDLGKTEPRFLWVYDCGTSSSKHLIDESIHRLVRFVGTRKRIDLLTLSHFDADHINGVIQLLQHFKVGTLMLPYMPLAQRLVIAFEENDNRSDDPLIGFFVDPFQFLISQNIQGIDEILFVPPSRNEGPPYPGEPPSTLTPEEPDSPQLQYKHGRATDKDDALGRTPSTVPPFPRESYLDPGQRIVLPSCRWEFIPYNDDPSTPITADFVTQVKSERRGLLSAHSPLARKRTLARLKKSYDLHFGSSSRDRNLISLFLYSGPIYSTWKHTSLDFAHSLDRHWQKHDLRPRPDLRSWIVNECRPTSHRRRCSILYSGDGYLDLDERLQNLITFLDPRRVERIGAFQVMHHGANANWRHGTAEAIAPLFSVFCSDPQHRQLKHPHADVLRDFWRYGPTQVDKSTDFTAYGLTISRLLDQLAL